MADEQDSGSCVDYPRVGSSPIFRINNVFEKVPLRGFFLITGMGNIKK